MNRIKRWIGDYFGYSPKETRGFLLLMILIFFSLIIPSIVKPLLPANDTTKEDIEKLESIAASLEQLSTEAEKQEAVINSAKLSLFNPNTATEEDFRQLGLEEKIAKRISNYRAKGGKFFIKSDFGKIYGISEEKYAELAPYIDLPENKEVHAKSSFPVSKARKAEFVPRKAPEPFDINLADSSQLIAIDGIGNKLAKRIISYRNKLGGFTNESQFKEIYGLDSVVIEKLRNTTFVSPEFTPRKTNINTASLQELKSHPYIPYAIAKTIIAYREQHGQFASLSDLKKIHTLSPEILNRLDRYLEL